MVIWICNYDSLSKHRLTVGLTYTLWCDFTSATRRVLSLLILTSIILAKGQVEQGTPVSAMRTRPPTWKFLFLTFHFFLLVNKGTYSFNHLCQNMSVAACTPLHLFLRLMSSVSVTHGWKFGMGLTKQGIVWCNWLQILNIITSRCLGMAIDIFNSCNKSR